MDSDLLEDPSVIYEEIPHISMNALSRVNSYQTMKIVGTFLQHPLHITH